MAIFRRRPPNGGIKCRWSRHKYHNFERIAGYQSMTAGHASNSCDRLLCSLSHRWRDVSESLFITACSMDEYAEEKRTEQNLIICSGKSEVEVTNNKSWRSRYHTAEAKYRQAQSITCNRCFILLPPLMKMWRYVIDPVSVFVCLQDYWKNNQPLLLKLGVIVRPTSGKNQLTFGGGPVADTNAGSLVYFRQHCTSALQNRAF